MEASQKLLKQVDLAIQHLSLGEIIAYPTESVYGLGCDIMNASAVQKLLHLKNRPLGKGLIVVGSTFEQLEFLIEPISPRALSQVLSSWPGPVTWVFPASPEAPKWITGDFDTIAIRVSAHPIIQTLCNNYQKPIVSTSANKAGQYPARCQNTLEMTFGSKIPMIISGQVGGLQKPTTIRDAITGETLRP